MKTYENKIVINKQIEEQLNRLFDVARSLLESSEMPKEGGCENDEEFLAPFRAVSAYMEYHMNRDLMEHLFSVEVGANYQRSVKVLFEIRRQSPSGFEGTNPWLRGDLPNSYKAALTALSKVHNFTIMTIHEQIQELLLKIEERMQGYIPDRVIGPTDVTFGDGYLITVMGVIFNERGEELVKVGKTGFYLIKLLKKAKGKAFGKCDFETRNQNWNTIKKNKCSINKHCGEVISTSGPKHDQKYHWSYKG